jgi:predicted negative regulator of RcsB-dependent stress response
MDKKSKWKFLIVSVTMFILAFGLYAGYTFWETENNEDVRKIREASAAQSDSNDEVAVFQQEDATRDYKTVGNFISKFHEEYNQSLGWGGIESVKWDEQKEAAAEVLEILQKIHTDNPDLETDFIAIFNFARIVEGGSKDKEALLKLHRYFHDLDIEFNGYKKTNDYFDVTEYKRTENG